MLVTYLSNLLCKAIILGHIINGTLPETPTSGFTPPIISPLTYTLN